MQAPACLPAGSLGASCPDWIGSPGPREPPRGPPVGAGKRWDPGRVFPSGALASPGLPAWTWRGEVGLRCVCLPYSLSTSGGAQKPARARAFSGVARLGGRRAAAVLGHRLHHSWSLRSASPGSGRPHRGCPGLPPTSCLGGADPELHARTLRAVCSLFAEVLWPVFWFSYVLESHKLKTGHFPDLIQVTCRLPSVCRVAVLS